MTTLAIIYLVTFVLNILFALADDKHATAFAALTNTGAGVALAIAALA